MLINRRQLSVPAAAIFLRQMAAMVGAGVPIKEALSLVAQDRPDLTGFTQRYMADAFDDTDKTDFFRRVFSYLEKRNRPDKDIAASLYSIADELDKYREFKVAMSQILFIPIMTLIVTFLVMAIILVFVIPVWQELFNSMHGQLPATTRMVIHISRYIGEHGHLMVLFILIVVGLLVAKRRSLPTVFSRLPLARRLIVFQSMVRFARYLAVLLHLDVPLREAAVVAAGEVCNKKHAKTLAQAVNQMTDHHLLGSSLQKSGIVTSVVGRIIDTGEKSGTLPETLNAVSVHYEKEADIALSQTVYWSDILIKFMVGIIVGIIVISMYLPIFRLAGAVM